MYLNVLKSYQKYMYCMLYRQILQIKIYGENIYIYFHRVTSCFVVTVEETTDEYFKLNPCQTVLRGSTTAHRNTSLTDCSSVICLIFHVSTSDQEETHLKVRLLFFPQLDDKHKQLSAQVRKSHI